MHTKIVSSIDFVLQVNNYLYHHNNFSEKFQKAFC